MDVGRNDPCRCGSGKKFKKCCLDKVRPEASVAVSAADLLSRAASSYQAGRLLEAKELCQRLIARGERLADARHLYGLLLLAEGDHAGALAALDSALSVSSNPQILSNRGLALQALGRHAEAVESFQASLRSDGREFLVWMNLAKAQRLLGELAGAEESYRRVLTLKADFPGALSALPRVILEQQRAQEALDFLLDAESRVLPTEDMLAVKGLALRALGRPSEVLDVYREAVRRFPGEARVHSQLGVMLRDQSDMEEALQAFHRAHELNPSLETAIDLHLSLPPVLRSREDITQWRTRFVEGIQTLTESRLSARVSEFLFPPSLFYLAFHGEDDRAVMESLSRMYLRLLPDLSFVAPHIAQSGALTAGRKPRIGFFSKFIHTHSVSRCFSALIKRMAMTANCDIYLASPQDINAEAAREHYGDFSGQFVRLPKDFLVARQTLAELELDTLIYLDIGMEAMSYFMAHARLAPVQMVMSGHPVTSGIATVDYYFSSELAESACGADHYSEKLVLMSALNSVYVHPTLPALMKGRREFGLPEAGALYVCPMLLQKIHPDFDEAVARILEGDATAHVVFFESRNQSWQLVLKKRFDTTIPPAVRGRVIFLPWQTDYGDFLAANAVADVVLDPFHFGIGSTAAATFAVHTPIVTLPGAFMRGRGGLTYCRLLDLPECVASDLDDYVRRALALAHDLELRTAVRARIAANKHRFFDNETPVEELSQHLLQLTPAAQIQRVNP